MLIYICAPYSADTDEGVEVNINLVKQYAIELAKRDIDFIAPHLNSAMFHKIESLQARTNQNWIDMYKRILLKCDGVLAVGNWKAAEGCIQETNLALMKHVPIYEHVDDIPKGDHFVPYAEGDTMADHMNPPEDLPDTGLHRRDQFTDRPDAVFEKDGKTHRVDFKLKDTKLHTAIEMFWDEYKKTDPEAYIKVDKKFIEMHRDPKFEFLDEPQPSILEEAMSLTSGDRNEDYGHPRDDFKCAIDMFNIWIEHKQGNGPPVRLSPLDHPIYMLFVKLAREANKPKRDNLVDIAGYLRCLAVLNGYEEL